MSRKQLLPALALASTFLACGGGSSSSDDGGGGGNSGGGTAQVYFNTISTDVDEDGNPAVVLLLTMSATEAHDVFVNFTTTGDAQANGDYVLLTQTPVKIPELATSAVISLQLIDDAKGETDETIRFEIVSVQGALIGPQPVHTVTIRDDDGSTMQESEPNDTPAEADLVGTILKTQAYEVTGNVEPPGGTDIADVFLVEPGEDQTIDFEVDPAASTALIRLERLDQAGTVLATYQSTVPGAPVGGQISVLDGDLVFFRVSTEISQTAYFLRLVGLEF